MAKPTPNPSQEGNELKINPGSSFSSLLLRSHSGYELEEIPTRSSELARKLIDLVSNCPEAAAALETICAFTFSSGTGDEFGFAVTSDSKDVGERVNSFLARCFSLEDYSQIVWRTLAWGDCFAVAFVDTSKLVVRRVALLPTWQIFRIETDLGELQHFSQQLPGLATNEIQISPYIISHWRYNPRYLYGRSLFWESIWDWEKLKEADEDLAFGSRSSGIVPNVHTMPEGATEDYKAAYKADYEARRKKGIIPDVFLLNGGELSKAGETRTNFLTPLLTSFNERRARIAMRSRVPFYLLGIETRYAREIAGQPAIGFSVFIGIVRQLFAQGLRSLINLELALQGMEPPYEYNFVFPKIQVNPYEDMDVDKPGVSDIDG